MRANIQKPNLRRHNRRKEDYFPLGGGLDLTTPPINLSPGSALYAMNYEPGVNGGYTRMLGFERFSGKTSPSDMVYYILRFYDASTEIEAGFTIEGGNSGATGYVLLDAIVESGSYGGGDAAGYIVFTNLTDNFEADEDIEVSSTPYASATAAEELSGAETVALDKTYRIAAIEYQRSQIAKPSGSGPVREVFTLNGDQFCVRDNAGATAGVLFKATTAGWVAQDLGYKLAFTAGSAEFSPGETITGGTSTKTAEVRKVILQSGTWGAGTAAGYLTIYDPTGAFGAAETITSAGGSATTSGTQVANTLPAGGRYEHRIHNFFGNEDTRAAYVCNGVGRAFEWDGESFTYIITGMSTDTPEHIDIHKGQLFLYFDGGSVQNSSPDGPFSWSVVLGANEIGVGEDVSGSLSFIEDALIIYTRNSTSVLYGSTVDDFVLKTLSPNTGALPWTIQKIGDLVCLDDRGITTLTAAQTYGNFEDASISSKIQPMLESLIQQACASVTVKKKNQYRLFFDDGTGIVVGFKKRNLIGFTQFDYGKRAYCTDSAEDSSGKEIILFGGDDGYVYQAEKGNSYDGEMIEHYLVLPYYHYKTPSLNKQFRLIVPELDADASMTLYFQPDFSYGDPSIPLPASTDIFGGGGAWNVDNWGEFVWSSQVVTTALMRVDGEGVNMGLYFYGETNIDRPHTIHGLTVQYSYRGLRR